MALAQATLNSCLYLFSSEAGEGLHGFLSACVCMKEVLFVKDMNLLHASFILGFLVNY